MEDKATVLIVDDELGPRESVHMVLKPFYHVELTDSGEQALDVMRDRHVDLVMLDIRMPGLQGPEVLRNIKQLSNDTEVIILTGYGSLKTAVDALRYGAADYLLKPFNVAELLSAVRRTLSRKQQIEHLKGFLDELGDLIGYQTDVSQFIGRLRQDATLLESVSELLSTYRKDGREAQPPDHLAFARILSETLEGKDPYTHGHSNRVVNYSNLIAEKLYLSQMECIELQIGAYLHDIGTLGLDNNLVYKTGAYDAAELEQIKHHPEIGVKLLSPIGLPQYIISIVRHHHERYDGTGYPDGLKGESIPLLTRIVTLADSFDAMVTDRSYRKALQWEEVIRRIKEGAGVQFDPHLVQILLKMMDEKGKQFLVEPSGKA